MRKKVISILIVIGVISAILMGMFYSNSTYAGTGKLYTNLSALNPNGIGYGIGDPTNKGKYIWHMSTYDSLQGGLSSTQKDIYCLKGDYGASWGNFTGSSPILEYNIVFDLQQGREELLSKLVENDNDEDEIVKELLDVNGNQYREILWLLDNMYIMGEENKDEYLAKAGVMKDEYEGTVEYYNSTTGKIYGEEALTEADIMAIQRVAIWTFTNGGDFDKTESQNWLNITTDAISYNILGDSRRHMAEDVYNYLISSAKEGANLYTAENNYTIDNPPIEVNTDKLIEENGKYKINTNIKDSNYIIGPLVIEKNNDFLYKISMKLTDENNIEIASTNYEFTDSNGTIIENASINDFIGNPDGFYIKIDKNIGKKVNVQIQIVHYTANKNLWLQGTEENGQIKLTAEQPIAELSKKEVTTSMEFIAEPELIGVTVEKIWEDANNQDGIRPNEITIDLLKDGEKQSSIKLNTTNSWKYKFENLPKYENGTEIEYTVQESEVPSQYASETTGNMENGYVITNTYVPETTSVKVEKIWEDGNNQDGIRPNEITIDLLKDGEKQSSIKLNTTNSWKYKFENLPKYENGTEIEYTVQESEVPSQYASETTGNMENGYVITNTYVPETTSVKVEKIWEDGNNQDGIRPNEITVKLLKNGEEQSSIKLNNANTWKHTFENLPKYENGTEIEYTVQESEVPSQYASETTGDMETGYVITNTYIPETTEVSVEKIWEDANNQDGIRPNEIIVNLLKDGTEYDNIGLNTTNNWKHTFENLPKYENGTEIEYTVQESEVPAQYSSETTGDMETGYVITNTYVPGTTSLRVVKIWEDENNQDGIRPNKITIVLLKNGEEYDNVELNSNNNWQYTFSNLPEKENNELIEYSVKELEQIEGYTSMIVKNNNSNSIPEYIITNKHETKTKSIEVEKIWDDESDYDKIRPQSIIVNIKNGDQIVQSATLNKENNWNYIFTDLPVKENGIDINYEVEEVSVKGYTSTIKKDSNNENKYIITNTHIPEKTFDLALRKYITKINNNEITTLGMNTRVPQIDTKTIETKNTATYKHRKDPLEVEENDIITYSITIYNEGEKAGYASQIIDQLPEGLICMPTTSVISKDGNGVKKNTYKITYEVSTNKVILDIINTEETPAQELNPYTNGTLDSETIELKCKVVYTAKANESNILTNVAWINEAYNKEDNRIITTQIGEDIDSEPANYPKVSKDNMEDYKGNDDNPTELSNSEYFYEGQQDDDDFEKIRVKTFDLSLRKFITLINNEVLENSREPKVDITPLQNETGTTAIYNHSKVPVGLKSGDKIIYTIRVYNEGEIDGYASEITDYLPPYLEYVENSTINNKYKWKIAEDGRIAITTYLKDKELLAFDGAKIDYEDIQIECKILENAIPKENITNIAEISEYKYGEIVYSKDVDSESNNIDKNLPKDEDLPKYKEELENDIYVPGNEDDDDFEKIYVKEFDLALRKFITKVQDKDITSRIPQVKNENGVISYEHTKEPLTVHVGDIVTYTIRIYNEGEIDGYASEITDNIPEYLEYLPENSTNVEYMWKMYDENGNETANAEQAVKVKTTYLSKENGKNNLLTAFDQNTLYYRDIKISFKVKDPNSNLYIITNYAQISDDRDKDNNHIKDKDSQTDKWNDGEDDQDIENIKVEYFDLSILKFVSKVIVQENGTEKITKTGYNGHENPEPIVKVELHRKKIDEVTVKFGFGITITNEGDIPGYATEITDYIPEGLKFEQDDNPNWIDEGNNVVSTKQLENVLLQPGESKTVEVILTWINGSENLALKTNMVEISEDKNEYNVPDRDSTPNNQKEGEDDIDIAEVMLVISTGTAKTYFKLILILLGIIAIGIFLIKKYVI